MPDIELLGAVYPDVPAVDLPQSGHGGMVRFYAPSEIKYAGSPTSGGPATVSNGLHYAQVDSTSTSTVYTVTIPGIDSYYDGLTVVLKNGVVTSASGFTININGLGAKPVYNNMAAAGRETTIFNINYTLLLIYDEDRVDGGCWINYRGYYSDSNYVPTGYCTTAAGTAAKSATCTYGYRDDDNYFPCLFRYANTAANATLAIASYATTAAPIYVNGARTSSSNTFGRGVILFLYHNGAYYCYNDGRFPILVDGAVTSVQEYVATKYTKPSGGIPKTDLASAVQTSLGKADTALQTHQSLKTINGNSLVGSGNISIPALPAVTASDNGKVATVVNGAWSAAEGGGGGSAWDFVIKCTNPNGFSSNASDYVWEVGSIDEAIAKYIATKNLTGYVYANIKQYDDEEDYYTYYYDTLFLRELYITGDESLSWYSPFNMRFTGYRTSMGAGKCSLTEYNLYVDKMNDDPELPPTYRFSKKEATMTAAISST